MNKKIITGLIVLMGISIVGIVIIQLVWMSNAIKLRNELFDRSVTEALNATANRLDTEMNFGLINHFSFNNSGYFDEPMPTPPFPPGPPPPSKTKPLKIFMTPHKSPGKIEMIINSKIKHPGFQFNFAPGKGKNRAPKDTLIAVNADSLGKIYAHGIHRFDSIVANFEYEQDSMGKIKQEFKVRSQKLKRVAQKAVQEISTWEEETPVDTIKSLLEKELNNRNIPIAFETGIIRDSHLTAKTHAADSALLKSSNYQANLYPNDVFQKNAKLAVYFPEKDSFIFKTLNWLLIVSLVFSVIVLLTFAVSIFFILKQKKISEMKSDFINNMTHEFKTPIATISVAADSIANQKVIQNPERIRYFVDMIKKENLRMNRQVEDILTIARLDKKEFEFKWEAFNLHAVIENAIQSILLQVEKKGGTIASELLAVNPVATSDPSHFANLIYNLLDNANKYSLNEPQITISTRNTSKGVVITVADQGIGMSKIVQNRIFERFYRQTSGNIHNVKGFGLGLSYVKAVVEANKGGISVHSEPGKGSTFEVFIPFVIE
jgi:two-component system phosphate regulon sensor histidine kinase PhoR